MVRPRRSDRCPTGRSASGGHEEPPAGADERAEIAFLGEIPLDARIRVRSDRGRPVVLESADSPVARAFHGVAGRLAARISVANAATVDSDRPC